MAKSAAASVPDDALALSKRGERTRASLVAASRVVFERDGFAPARIVDIAAIAGTAVGSFYTYFDSKEEIFRAVVEEVSNEFTVPLPRSVGSDPVARIQAGNRAYVRSYMKHARILAVMQHRTFEDPELYALRQRDLFIFVDRAERAIRRLQDSGQIERDLPPRFAATALCGMVHAYCYETFAFGTHTDLGEDEIVDGLATLWSRALGITITETTMKTKAKKKGRAT